MADKTPTLWDDLRSAIDELEVKTNLAGNEVRARWDALKPRLQVIKETMAAKTAEANAWVSEEMELIGAEVNRLKGDVAARLKKDPK